MTYDIYAICYGESFLVCIYTMYTVNSVHSVQAADYVFISYLTYEIYVYTLFRYLYNKKYYYIIFTTFVLYYKLHMKY